MAGWEDFAGLNRGYVLELYDKFRSDPASVDAGTRANFETWGPPQDAGRSGSHTPDMESPAGLSPNMEKVVGLVKLTGSIRRYGHLASKLDPLGSTRQGDPALDLATYGLTESDLKQLPASLISGPVARDAAHAFDAIERLRAIYCGTIGYDFAHIFVPEERQ